MTYCPKCGTANRDGSRFCNECGEKLGTQTHVTCTQCGTLNPAHNVFCSECRGRLLPAVASPPDSEATPTIRGHSLSAETPTGEPDEEPTTASTPESEEEIPAWLSELGATLSEEDKSDETDYGEDATEIPAWLLDLRDSLPTETEAEMDSSEETEDIPGWLAESQPSPAEEGSESAQSTAEAELEQAPDWLAELRFSGIEAESEPPQLPSEAELEGEEGPGWLAELQPMGAEEEPAPPTSEAEEEEAGDWLAELRSSGTGAESEAPQPSSEAEMEEEEPAWLAELQPMGAEEEPAPPASEAEEEEAGDWLAELRSSGTGAESEAPQLPSEANMEAEEPAWLAELQPMTTEDESIPLIPEGEREGEPGPDRLTELQPSTTEDEPMSPIPEAEIEGEARSDWLDEPQPTDTEERPIPPSDEAEVEQVPDWLAELQPSIATGEPSPPIPEIGEGEMPAWLAELRPSAEEEKPELTPPADEAEVEGTPDDWLATLRPPTVQEDAPLPDSAAEKTSDELPERGPSAEEEAPIPPTPDVEAGKVPDWLATLQPLTIDVEPERTPAEPEDEVEEATADWLAEFLPPTPVEEPLAEVQPEDLSWIAELEVEAPEEALFPDEGIPAEAESPDWFVSTAPDLEEGDSLAQAEIPAWLMALKPAELREEGEEQGPASVSEEPIEESGLLAGLHGILPVEMIIAQPRAVLPKEVLEGPPVDTPQARLFADIVGRPPEAGPKEIVSPPTHALALIPRLIIFVALIAAVSLPLLLEEPLFPRSISATPATVDMYSAIESLATDAPVLVAFDYDPTTSGEMNVLAQALVGHLMDREAKVVAVSLLPAGPATAQSVLDQLAAERPSYAAGYGQRYVNLGYLPGQASAVRLMGFSLETALPRDFEGTQGSELPILENLSTTQDFDLIVELAATQETLRWWIEQAGMPYEIPLGAGVSASVDPFARPYLETDSQQLVGMVSGVAGAATYDALRSGQDSPEGAAAARLDSLMVGQMILILVLLVGNGVYLAQRGTGRQH